jgi:hypothetical protein
VGDGKGARKEHYSSPYRNVIVMDAKAKGNLVECTFNVRKTVGTKSTKPTLVEDKKTKSFQCSSSEHAELLAKHAKKLHARRNKSGLIYSITKLADDEILLRKARDRAAKKYAIRQLSKEYRANLRRLAEERKVKAEKATPHQTAN